MSWRGRNYEITTETTRTGHRRLTKDIDGGVACGLRSEDGIVARDRIYKSTVLIKVDTIDAEQKSSGICRVPAGYVYVQDAIVPWLVSSQSQARIG